MLEYASFEHLWSLCAHEYYSVVHVVAASFPGEGYLRESSGLAMFEKGKRV